MTAVHQVLSSAGPYDAVSVQARLWRALLTERGYGGTDHADSVDPRARADFAPLERLRPARGDLLVIRWSAYSPRLLALLERPERKLLVYHNVTPAGYFWNHHAGVALACAVGRAQLPMFARAADVCAADSEFNARRPARRGCRRARAADPVRPGAAGRARPGAGGRRPAGAGGQPPGPEQAPRPGHRRVRGMARRARRARADAVRGRAAVALLRGADRRAGERFGHARRGPVAARPELRLRRGRRDAVDVRTRGLLGAAAGGVPLRPAGGGAARRRHARGRRRRRAVGSRGRPGGHGRAGRRRRERRGAAGHAGRARPGAAGRVRARPDGGADRVGDPGCARA